MLNWCRSLVHCYLDGGHKEDATRVSNSAMTMAKKHCSDKTIDIFKLQVSLLHDLMLSFVTCSNCCSCAIILGILSNLRKWPSHLIISCPSTRCIE